MLKWKLERMAVIIYVEVPGRFGVEDKKEGCVEYAFSIWDAIQNAKSAKEDLSVIWLDFTNAYGSVSHAMIKEAMEHFWIRQEVQDMMMMYYNKVKMRFTAGDFTTKWQRLEVGIAAECTISVILFLLVMEMILTSRRTEDSPREGQKTHLEKDRRLTSRRTEGFRITTSLRAFMDDITTLSKPEATTRSMLKLLNEVMEYGLE